MRKWLSTFPLLNRPLPETGPVPADYEDWSVDELLAGRRFAQSAPTAPPMPPSSMGSAADAATTASLPGWLASTQWLVAPAQQPGPRPVLPVSDDPFERFTIRTSRSAISPARGRPSEPPQDYPSYLGPVPRVPDWAEVPTAATPGSPLARLPHATDWDRFFAGGECYSSEDGLTCTTQGGRRFTVRDRSLPPGTRIAPDERGYHSYMVPDGPVAGIPSVTDVAINRPTRGPSAHVLPASPEGTPNEAAPPSVYYPTLGYASGRVRSYLTRDQTGAQVVVNVTEPGHPLYPGVVFRYQTDSPAGGVIRNEGIGLGWQQSPNAPSWIRNPINTVWEGQVRDTLGAHPLRRPARPLGRR